MRAPRRDAKVLDKYKLAKDAKAEEESAMEDVEKSGAAENCSVGEGGADRTARLHDIAGRFVDCDSGREATGETRRRGEGAHRPGQHQPGGGRGYASGSCR